MNELILNAASAIFARRSETKGYTPDYKNDLGFVSNGYVFVIQTKNGFNNILFAKFSNGNLGRALKEFKDWLIGKHIQCIRIEGTTKRYNFLPKLFKDIPFVKEDNKDRNIFYAKLFI